MGCELKRKERTNGKTYKTNGIFIDIVREPEQGGFKGNARAKDAAVRNRYLTEQKERRHG